MHIAWSLMEQEEKIREIAYRTEQKKTLRLRWKCKKYFYLEVSILQQVVHVMKINQLSLVPIYLALLNS